jgi:hypothetical protein
MPNQVLITVYLSGVGTGVPNVGGWSSGQGAAATPSYGGWDVGAFAWVSQAEVSGLVTAQDVYNTINLTKPLGVTVWVQIVGSTPAIPPPWWSTQKPTSLPAVGGVLSAGVPASYALLCRPPCRRTSGFSGTTAASSRSPATEASAGTPAWVAALPATLPGSSGQLWNDGLVVAIS